ncbi:MAG: hypothetical protein ACKVJT_11705, partial [Alphaproteobacteria bacterium]
TGTLGAGAIDFHIRSRRSHNKQAINHADEAKIRSYNLFPQWLTNVFSFALFLTKYGWVLATGCPGSIIARFSGHSRPREHVR